MALVFITQHEQYYDDRFKIQFAQQSVRTETGDLVFMGAADVTDEAALAWYRERPHMYRIVEPVALPAEPKAKGKAAAPAE